jgi:hypothetical protein
MRQDNPLSTTEQQGLLDRHRGLGHIGLSGG